MDYLLQYAWEMTPQRARDASNAVSHEGHRALNGDLTIPLKSERHCDLVLAINLRAMAAALEAGARRQDIILRMDRIEQSGVIVPSR